MTLATQRVFPLLCLFLHRQQLLRLSLLPRAFFQQFIELLLHLFHALH